MTCVDETSAYALLKLRFIETPSFFLYFSYVLQLISLVNKTLNVKVNACTKLETPYGMELRWRLPGGMHFHIHLKDNLKVGNMFFFCKPNALVTGVAHQGVKF